MSFTLRSSAFVYEGDIPMRYSGEGENLSPPLSWGALPHGTKELALSCLDSDLRLESPWVHWLLYKIPVDLGHLDEGLAKSAILQSPVKMFQGKNSWDKIGYDGPFPPKNHGWHSYHFRLYALGTELDVKAGLSWLEFSKAMEGHVRTQTDLVGRYQLHGLDKMYGL